MRTILLLAVLASLAADWPRFRGPNGAGLGEAAPTQWTASENRLWKVELPGKGNGSPIVLKNKLFAQCATDSARMLVCLDSLTGKELWSRSQKGQTGKAHGKNSLASGTPASDGERVFACFWDGRGIVLAAFSLDGQELWSENLGDYASQHGAGLSPMTHAGLVVVNSDSDDAAEVFAFHAATGKKAWSAKRKSYRASYATPMVRELPDKSSEIIAFSTAALTAYDPASGKVNWEWAIPWGNRALRGVASPVIVNDVFVVATGDGDGSRMAAAIRPGKTPEMLWQQKSNRNAPYVPCPVAVGKNLVWLTDQGKLECLDPLTGKAKWSETIFSGSVSASPVLLGDVLLMIDERGKAIAGKADEKGFTQLSTSDVGGPVFATPAAADGRLYLRTGSTVICVGAK